MNILKIEMICKMYYVILKKLRHCIIQNVYDFSINIHVPNQQDCHQTLSKQPRLSLWLHVHAGSFILLNNTKWWTKKSLQVKILYLYAFIPKSICPSLIQSVYQIPVKCLLVPKRQKPIVGSRNITNPLSPEWVETTNEQ